LRRLLLIHGRYSYHRSSFVANYCFYKSLFICFMQILYQFYCGFSGTTFFNSFSLMSYNVIFTGVTIMGYVLDKDLPEHVITNNPFLYRDSQSARSFNFMVFASWFVRAFLQAFAVFIFTVFIFRWDVGGDYVTISLSPFTVAIIIQTFTLVIEAHSMTIINHLLVWGTLGSYFLITTIVNLVVRLDMYGAIFVLFSSPLFWYSVFLMTIISMGPVLSIKYYYYHYLPSPAQIISYLCHLSISFTLPASSPQEKHIRRSFCADSQQDDAEWVVQMIRYEGGEQGLQEGGKYLESDRTPLLREDRKAFV